MSRIYLKRDNLLALSKSLTRSKQKLGEDKKQDMIYLFSEHRKKLCDEVKHAVDEVRMAS